MDFCVIVVVAKRLTFGGRGQSLDNKLRYVFCVTIENGQEFFFGRFITTLLIGMFTTNFDI